jgi:hypothetical protein
MIVYLVTSTNFYTTTAYFSSWGRSCPSKPKLMFYEHLPSMRHLPAATYIFSDIERLTPHEAEIAAQVWHALAGSGLPVRLLNHPTRSMRRYELLRTLYEQGINTFNIYHVTELCRPHSFPVFLRGENDHGGSLTTLLYTPEELESAIEELDRQGKSRDDKVIVEFCDTSDEQGTFRKYAAFIIDGCVVPTHIFFSRHWMAKMELTETDVSQAALEEELAFVERNPHAEALSDIARRAHIDYGRIDYAVINGKVQVWEINTNPMLPRLNFGGERRRPVLDYSTQRINRAFETIDSPANSVVRIANPAYQGGMKRLGKLMLSLFPLKYRPYARTRLKHLHKSSVSLFHFSKH